MAGEAVSLHAMFDVIRSAPTDQACLSSPAWKPAPLLAPAGGREGPGARDVLGGRLRRGRAYWLGHFPTLGEKTRGSIVAMFSTLAEALMRGKMRELFCAADDPLPRRT